MKTKSRRARMVGGALTTAALALSLLLPGAVSAQTDFGLSVGPLNLQRDCGLAGSGMDAQGQCSYAIAQPSGSQGVDVSALNQNSSLSDQLNSQSQENLLTPDASVTNVAAVGGLSPRADLVVKSGSVDVAGHWVDVNMGGAVQEASASPSGIVDVSNVTGSVTNTALGTNIAATNAGALNSSDSLLGGSASLDANGAIVGGNGGSGQGNIAGNGPTVTDFGVGGGWGGSNVNLALGSSTSVGGLGGTALSSSDMGRYPDNYAFADGGSARAGYGAQADPSQVAGNGGDAAFAVSGRGGNASGDNSANGGEGIISNSNSVDGSSYAWGAAIGGNAGNASAGPQQGGITGQNDTTVTMNGGIAVNSMNVGVFQRGDVIGQSGNVANTGSPSAQANVAIDQSSSPLINVTNEPTQSASNLFNNTQGATSGNQTANPSLDVSTGNQGALNLGGQDALKTSDSFNTDNSFSNNVTRISGRE